MTEATSVEDLVADTQFIHCVPLTLCVLTTTNGTKVIGQFQPIKAADYDHETGQAAALDEALRQLWLLESYARRG